MVDRDAIGRSDGILPAVTFADGVFFVILAVEIEAQVVEDLTCLFRQAVFLDEREHSQLDRRQARRQFQDYALFPILQFLFRISG